MLVVDGVYIYCHAEGKESRRNYMYFLLACVYHFATYYGRRKVEVVYFYFSVCIYMLGGGGMVMVMVVVAITGNFLFFLFVQ